MQKTVLIPTDFTVESLILFKKYVLLTDAPVNILFFHCESLSDSIVELLFNTTTSTVDQAVRKTFDQAWNILKSKYDPWILSSRMDVFYGKTQSSFTNFLDANRVTEIVAPAEYKFARPTNNSFDPMPFIRACRLPKTEISWPPMENTPEKNQLAELFLNN